MRFKPGQEVTPNIKNEEWKVIQGFFMPFPEFGKIYTVSGYPMPHFPEMITLEEFGDKFVYFEDRFEPLVPTEKIAEDLENVDIEHQINRLSDTIQQLLDKSFKKHE